MAYSKPVYWYEVQFSDHRANMLKGTMVLSASVEPLSDDDLEYNEQGQPEELTSFVGDDVFCVVRVVTEEPLDAVRRALLLLRPDVLQDRRDVSWHNLNPFR